MALRYFRNGPARALAVPLANSTDTSITVDSASGFPTQFPYTLILDPDQSTEEVCDVTAAAGNILTLARGVDGTTAVAHGAGAVVYHGVSARDPREANEHVNATTNVHGRTGALVDTDSVQSIPGRKVFDDLETTGGGDVLTVGASQTVTGAKTFSALATMNGGQTVAGAESHAGAETHAGTETHTGTVSYTNTETHSGAETHSGTVRFSNAAMQAVSAESDVDESTTSVTFVPGATPVGVAFVAPPSGRVLVFLSANFWQTQNGQSAFVVHVLRNGAVVGSGTTVDAGDTNKGLIAGQAVNAGAEARLGATRVRMHTGLTPGNSYNVRIEFNTTAGGGNQVFHREILVQPVI